MPANCHRLFVNLCTSIVSVVLLQLFMLPVLAQSSTLISISLEPHAQLEIPNTAQSAEAVVIHLASLQRLSAGDRVRVQLSSAQVIDLTLSEVSQYLNGDTLIRGLSIDPKVDASLTMTFGEQSLFGQLAHGEQLLQLHANKQGVDFLGWLYLPEAMLDSRSAFQNDYLLPPKVNSQALNVESMSEDELRFSLPLKLQSAAPAIDSNSVSIGDISETNFKISQQFNSLSVLAGNSIEAEISFENTSNQSHRKLSVEFYFVLENSELLAASLGCRQQLSVSRQTVLYCDLGDFEVGQIKTVAFKLGTSELSKPRIISSAIMGGLRVDDYVNVVDDIISDSDGDGVSDFNESLAGTDADDALSVPTENVVIDVMALYTQGASDLYPGGAATKINQLISVANQVYNDSGVGITLRPVYHGLVDYNDSDDITTALNHLINKTDPAFEAVDQLRERYGADLVMLFRPLMSEDSQCGLAQVGGYQTQGDFSDEIEKSYAYSQLAINCPMDIVVAHELGHNMGLTHSYLEDGTGGTFAFSTGYGVDSQFATVMAFPAAFNTDVRLANFSSPLLDCLGFACGVESDDNTNDAVQESPADAVLSLNLVKYQIANYFPTKVAPIPQLKVEAASGLASSARIAAGATTDGGLSYTQIIRANQPIDVNVDIQIEAGHIGLLGQHHVLADFGDGVIVQLDQLGNLNHWDGSLAGLSTYNGLRTLRSIEHYQLFSQFVPLESDVGKQIIIYIAYWIPQSEELIYTFTPLVLTIEAANRVAVDDFESDDVVISEDLY